MAEVQQHHVTGWTGWVGFAALFMAITGIYHIILGIGGVLGQDWYIYASGTAWWFDSSSWGWSMIVGGGLMTLFSYLLVAGSMFGRIVGVLLALGSLFVNLALV